MIRILLPLLVLLSLKIEAQMVSGFVYDSENKEPLISALVSSDDKFVFTDDHGRFSIVIKQDDILTIEYLGYDTQKVKVSDEEMSIPMLSSSSLMDEVTIVAGGQDARRKSVQMGLSSMNKASIKAIPMVLGEPDVLKALQTLPGVKFGVEGSSGLYVRGGSSGQNLILLDDVPIYNSNHGFGFFSAIPSELVKKVDIYKGGFPAEYGNRLSAVIDVKAIDGNKSKSETTIGFSTIAGKIAHQGPIVKEKLSYAVTGRYSLTPFFTPYTFYDGSLKLNFTPNRKNRLGFFMMTGGDVFDKESKDINNYFIQKNNIKWQNNLAGLSWSYFATNKLIFSVKTYGSYYQVESKLDRTPLDTIAINIDTTATVSPQNLTHINSSFDSNMLDLGVKTNVKYYLNSNAQLEYGNGLSNFLSVPENSEYIELSYDKTETLKNNSTSLTEQNSLLLYNYVKYNYDNGRLGVDVGMRLNNYFNGDYKHSSIDPRVAIKYELLGDHIVKASFSQVNQYSHYFTNDYLQSPTDSWLVATKGLEPSFSRQYSLGFFPKLKSSQWSIETEVYYKEIKEDIRRIPGHNFLKSSYYEKIGKIDGESYGLETLLKYNSNRLDVSLAYTLSKTDRIFQDKSIYASSFPYRYDKRHDFNVVGNYLIASKNKINKKTSHKLSFDFVFTSGANYTIRNIMVYNPIPTIYSEVYEVSRPVNSYTTGINNIKAPAYHRLNIGYSREVVRKNSSSTFRAGVYNAYNNKNVFILSGGRKYYYEDDFSLVNYSLDIKKNAFLPILPYLSYEITF